MREMGILVAFCLLFFAALLLGIVIYRALKRYPKGQISIGHFILLRAIHASWILLPPAFVFTILHSPYIFFEYYVSEVWTSISTLIFTVISMTIGYIWGSKLIDKVYLEYKIKMFLWFSCVLSMGLSIMVIVIDIQSVIEELEIWWMYGVILLLISVIILILPLIKES